MLVHAGSTPSASSAAAKTDGIAPPVLDVTADYTLAEFSHYYRAVSVDKQYTDGVAACVVLIILLAVGAAKGFVGNDWAAGLLCSVLTLPFLYYVFLPVIGPRSWYKRRVRAFRKSLLLVVKYGHGSANSFVTCLCSTCPHLSHEPDR